MKSKVTAYVTTLSFITGTIIFFPLGGCRSLIFGKNGTVHNPYYVVAQPALVKKLLVPAGAKISYETSFYRKDGEIDRESDENYVVSIEMPAGDTIEWAGVPVREISRFPDPRIKGLIIYPDFKKIENTNKSELIRLWGHCDDTLAVEFNASPSNDWSFHPENIKDVRSCSVLYQRFFKDNEEQQRFLDKLVFELKNTKG